MRLITRLMSASFTPLSLTNQNLEVTSYSWTNLGGPDTANITVWGDDQELWEFTNYLRNPLEIYDENGNAVWWGYVNTVTVRAGAIAIGVGLDKMNNRCATIYTDPGADTRSWTDWIQDDDSVTRYGTKEILLSNTDAGAATASALRDKQLAERKYPTPNIDHTPGQNSLSATLECLGWYHTLGWRYFQDLAGEESYTYEGLGTQYMGEVASCMEVRQSLMLQDDVDAWAAHEIDIKCRKANSPSSNLFVTLSSSNWDVLTSGSVSPSDVGPNHAWITFAISPSVTIQGSTLYYLRVHGASVPDPNNYYVININEEMAYYRGDFRLWNSASYTAGSNAVIGASQVIQAASWVARYPDADLEFRVLGLTDNATQLLTCASRAGQFFTGFSVDKAASILSSPHRDGDQLAKDVLEPLLQAGVASGNRYRAHVARDRRFEISEEPSYDSASPYLLGPDGRVFLGQEEINFQPPVGMWCSLRNFLPGNVNLQLIFDPSRFYIERATYEVQGNALRLEPRGEAEVFAVVKGG